MKKNVLTLLCIAIYSIVFCLNAYSQESYENLLKQCGEIDVESGKFTLLNGSRSESYNRQKMVSLINKDVFGFFSLNNEYKTELQRASFSQTAEYQKYMTTINHHHSYIFGNKFYILYNLRYNNAYDVNNKSFTFDISTVDYNRTRLSNYIGFGNNICTTFPSNKLNTKRVRAYNGELYAHHYINIPISDTNLALKMEKDMENPYCSTYLMFVVELDKVSSEKHPEFPFDQSYILCKTVNSYVVNIKEKKIYCDLSNILNK
ncbi:MAG: hypothetical protein SNH07_09240 [Rikenellaceae bacterium]